jgi:hypothetical protein
MDDEKIQVVTHSGYKASERPTAFVISSQEISVLKILDMWLEENFADRQRNRFFIIQGSDGFTYTLYMIEKTHEWFLRSRK